MIFICVYWFELFSHVSDVAHGPLVEICYVHLNIFDCSGIPSFCIGHIFRTFNKGTSPCDMKVTIPSWINLMTVIQPTALICFEHSLITHGCLQNQSQEVVIWTAIVSIASNKWQWLNTAICSKYLCYKSLLCNTLEYCCSKEICLICDNIFYGK